MLRLELESRQGGHVAVYEGVVRKGSFTISMCKIPQNMRNGSSIYFCFPRAISEHNHPNRGLELC